MSSPQQEAFQESAARNRALSQRAYGIALPGLQTEYQAINQALTQGEPAYLRGAYAGVRGGERESLAQGGNAALRASLAQNKGAVEGGNVGAITPQALGSQMAQALYGPRVQEASANLEQINKLMGAGLGQAQQTGSGALQATETGLQDIGRMRDYNMGYAGILGALNLGSSLYGGFNQSRTTGVGLDPRLGSSISAWDRTGLAAGMGGFS